jgi:hypothetical protein
LIAAAGCSPGPAPPPPAPPSGPPSATSPVTGEARGTSDAIRPDPLQVSVRQPTIPFKGSDGRFIATFELGLHNPTPLTLRLTRVEVRAPDGTVLQTLDAAGTAAALAVGAHRSGVTQLTEGQLGTLYLTPEFATREAVPDRLAVTVTAAAEQLPPGGVTSAPVEVPVSRFVPPVLGPPLEPGAGYIAADSCCGSERHRRAPLGIENRTWLAQRFAVDWEQLDPRGRTVRGENPASPADYTVYGKRVIAAAEGTVVEVVDGLPDQVPGGLPSTITLPEADGNHVVIDIGGGLYALYAHFKAGSITVREGQRVKRGDPLAQVGNSGNSSAPHLHFHVMDGPSPLASEGVPYVIDSFSSTGEITSTSEFDRFENTTTPLATRPLPGDGPHHDEMPLDRLLVTFN